MSQRQCSTPGTSLPSNTSPQYLQRLDRLRVDHNLLESGAGHGDVADIAVHEVQRLGTQASPQQVVGDPGRLDGLIDLASHM